MRCSFHVVTVALLVIFAPRVAAQETPPPAPSTGDAPATGDAPNEVEPAPEPATEPAASPDPDPDADADPGPVPEPTSPAATQPVRAAAPSTATTSAVRIYVAPFTGETADPGTLDLVEDRVLVASRAAIERVERQGREKQVEVLGARDVQSILDVEASKAAMGCDTTSCANEIADALNADEIIFGQLGHIGDTWQLTLTRTHRASLKVLARSVNDARGATAEGLLDEIPDQVASLFELEPEPVDLPTVVGIGTAIVGAVAVVVGGALYTYSWTEFFAAKDATEAPEIDFDQARLHRKQGQDALVPAYLIGGIGVGVVVIGGALWMMGGVE